MTKAFPINVTKEELQQAIEERRIVVIERPGKGETDFFDVYRIIDNQLYRIVGSGFNENKDCFAIGGGNFNKSHAIVEGLMRQVGLELPPRLWQNAIQLIMAP